jgi:hypothetical protein
MSILCTFADRFFSFFSRLAVRVSLFGIESLLTELKKSRGSDSLPCEIVWVDYICDFKGWFEKLVRTFGVTGWRYGGRLILCVASRLDLCCNAAGLKIIHTSFTKMLPVLNMRYDLRSIMFFCRKLLLILAAYLRMLLMILPHGIKVEYVY